MKILSGEFVRMEVSEQRFRILTIERCRQVHLAALGISLLLSGCALFPPRQLAAEDLARLRQGPPITAVVYQPAPSFRLSTAFDRGGIMLGPIGILASTQVTRAAGVRAIGMVELADPSIRIRDRAIAAITSGLGLPQPIMQENVRSDDIERLLAFLGPGVVLEFRTLDWGLTTATQNPFRQDSYALYVFVRARLLDLGEQKILWQNMCGALSPNKASVYELQQNDGERLKRWLVEAADACAKDLLAKFFPGSKGKLEAIAGKPEPDRPREDVESQTPKEIPTDDFVEPLLRRVEPFERNYHNNDLFLPFQTTPVRDEKCDKY